jgi:nicotinate-nucleotide pyrophosphorylase (carboxylating)
MYQSNETLSAAIERNVREALVEDIGLCDYTAQLVPDDLKTARLIVREDAILCGVANSEVCFIQARARALLSAERPALNFLQTLSATATITHAYVKAIEGASPNPHGCHILDTRKTLPGLRQAQKYAVTVGGGQNQRLALWDGILIKENHIAAAGGITQALQQAQALNAPVSIQIEVENLLELKEALDAGATSILLDNFSTDQMREAVQLTAGRALLEASGGVDLVQVREIAATGVDRISIGKLTKDVAATDYSLRVMA